MTIKVITLPNSCYSGVGYSPSLLLYTIMNFNTQDKYFDKIPCVPGKFGEGFNWQFNDFAENGQI